MAARLTIQNVGQETWTSARGTTFALIDRNNLEPPPAYAPGKVQPVGSCPR